MERRDGGVSDTLCSELARHWDLAGESERAAQAYVRAARQALDIFAIDETKAAVARALGLTKNDALRCEAHLLGEDAASRDGERAQQAQHLDALEQLAMQRRDRALWSDVVVRRIALANVTSDREREAALIGQLRAEADARADSLLAATALEAERACYAA